MTSPAGTPAPVVARFNEALAKVLALPDVRERLGRLGFAPRAMPPEQWRDYLQAQITMFTRLAREAGLEPS
ncbi:MAG: hypothetical protein K5Q68_17250 [Roseococcus sp.]|nr:hypothetical protein [Roseococcus sp.]